MWTLGSILNISDGETLCQRFFFCLLFIFISIYLAPCWDEWSDGDWLVTWPLAISNWNCIERLNWKCSWKSIFHLSLFTQNTQAKAKTKGTLAKRGGRPVGARKSGPNEIVSAKVKHNSNMQYTCNSNSNNNASENSNKSLTNRVSGK